MTPDIRCGADILAFRLAHFGCRHAFGLPGGEVLALMEALDCAGIAFHLTKHENVAGFMAEGTWHATGKPGILLATLGPGVANALNAVANAGQDRVPLIFLTGCVDAALAHRYTHQVFDHQAVLRPLVKASLRAEPGALLTVIDKALSIATSGQPGPVHIDVPIAVAEGPPQPGEPLPQDQPLPAPVSLGAPWGAPLEAARSALEAAERPLALIGLDALEEAGAGEAISAFIRAQGIPALTTYKAKGLVSEDDPLSLGGIGLSPRADKAVAPVLAAADLILCLGYDPIEMRAGWIQPWPVATPVIEVTPERRDHGMHRADHVLHAALVPSVEALGQALPRARWPRGEPAAARVALASCFAVPSAPAFGPHAVFETLRQVMPPQTVATADSGAHRILLSQMWRVHGPRQLLQSSALCTMGCSVALAAGHRLADDTAAPVLAFVGDAGLEMVLGDLATLRDLRLPVIVCVLVDESLALIELKQRATQRPNLGVDFGATDFPAVAQALGGYGVWVEDRETLRREAHAALQRRDHFTVLACRIGHRPYDEAF